MARVDDSSPDGEDLTESEVPTVVPGGNISSVHVDSSSIRKIAHFRLIELLGSGGQGEVYRAEDLKLRRRVALKILSRRFDFADDRSKSLLHARFEREAEVLARLDHPGICSVFEFGYEKNQPWLSMQLVEGQPLDQSIAKSRGPQPSLSTATSVNLNHNAEALGDAKTKKVMSPVLEIEEAVSLASPARDQIALILRVIESAAQALHVAHQAGLIHRDVKPGNIMVTPEGQAVLLDFGLAHDSQGDGPALTVTGDLMGTPSYMSPEQFDAGASALDRRSDIYSLGATLFECLCLRRPFEAPTREALRRSIHFDPTPDLRRLNQSISRDLATVVACAMEKDPNRRYQTMLGFANDIKRVVGHKPVQARPVGPFTKTWRWAQRNPVVASLMGALALFLIVGVIWTSLKNRELAEVNSNLTDTNQSLAVSTKKANLLTEVARKETQAKAAALAEYERMADARRLKNARSEASKLWPVGPDISARLEAWQKRYEPLFARRESHEKALAELESEARPYSEEDRKRDFATEIDHVQQMQDSKPSMRPEFRESLETRIKDLEVVIAGRRSWNFDDDVDRQFRHGALKRLVESFDEFVKPKVGISASIAKRIEFSLRIRTETLDDQAELWRACGQRVSNSKSYGKLYLKPQLGLIPLGTNPTTGLEEFLHWQTHKGPLPTRNDQGRLIIGDLTGIVFVLIPENSFHMGSQRDDPKGKNYDELSRGTETPLHEVTLDAFFVSKYEMTQGQWQLFTGGNPSSYSPGYKSRTMRSPVNAQHPIENITWFECREVLEQLGLQIPTEAQWECAARAGNDTVYVGTSDPAEVGRFANVAGAETSGIFSSADERFNDNYPAHAPVGMFEPNAFGLFDMNGNLWEWCRDRFGTYLVPPRSGDGLRPSALSNRQYRGGSFGGPIDQKRIAYRTETDPGLKFSALGIRPVRALTF